MQILLDFSTIYGEYFFTFISLHLRALPVLSPPLLFDFGVQVQKVIQQLLFPLSWSRPGLVSALMSLFSLG